MASTTTGSVYLDSLEFIKTLKELIEITRIDLITKIIEKSKLSEEQAKNLAEGDKNRNS